MSGDRKVRPASGSRPSSATRARAQLLRAAPQPARNTDGDEWRAPLAEHGDATLEAERADFASPFGYDFSRVRVKAGGVDMNAARGTRGGAVTGRIQRAADFGAIYHDRTGKVRSHLGIDYDESDQLRFLTETEKSVSADKAQVTTRIGVRTTRLRSGAGAPIQPKAQMGERDDPLEREADEVADRVLRMDDPSSPGAAGSATPALRAAPQSATPALRAAPQSAWGHGLDVDAGAAEHAVAHDGRPLPADLRAYFEPRFGHSFSGVRVHTGGEAARSARTVQARAYALGSDIVFAAGEFAPGTAAGRRLLAHELAHVLQQARSSGGATPGASVVRRQPAPPTPASAGVDEDDWRVDNFRIDEKDLSNPRVTGRLRSLSNAQLQDYRDKTKDSAVKTYVDNLVTFSTPTQAGSAIDPLTGKMELQVGKVRAVIEPDVRGVQGLKGAETKASVDLQPPNVPGFSFDAKNIVTEFPGYDPSLTLTVVTQYGVGTTPEATSGYGRGNVPADVRNRATSVRFHEGAHGEDYLEFVRSRPFPVFGGKIGDKRSDFEAAKTRFTDARTAWVKELDKVNRKGDCIGKTIDEYNKGEAGYKPICP